MLTYRTKHRPLHSVPPSHGPLWHTGHQTHTTDHWSHSDSKLCSAHLQKHEKCKTERWLPGIAKSTYVCSFYNIWNPLICRKWSYLILPAVPWWQMTDSRSYVVTWLELSLARKGRMSRPSNGKDTWLLILNEYMTSCRKRFRWMHRICTEHFGTNTQPQAKLVTSSKKEIRLRKEKVYLRKSKYFAIFDTISQPVEHKTLR